MASNNEPDSKVRILVMISGSGSNLQALIDKIQVEKALSGGYICGVISNRSTAFGLTRAANHKLPTSVLTLKSFKDDGKTRQDYDLALAQLVLSYKPTLIVLAGFMHILSPIFLTTLGSQVRIINLHPALPGQFDGAHAIDRAYEAFKEGRINHTGIMVHNVIAEVDQGEPIMTSQIPILVEDTLEDLENRIHNAEHELLFLAVKQIVEVDLKASS